MLIDGRYWRYAAYRAYLNLVADASRYHLGWLWWILEPMAMTAVFYVVFRFLRARDEDFIYFLIVGVTTWLWFSNSVSNATQSLVAAKGLITQIKVPKMMFPLVSVLTGCFKQSFRLRLPSVRSRPTGWRLIVMGVLPVARLRSGADDRRGRYNGGVCMRVAT